MILGDACGKFGYMFQDKATATAIKVIELFGEVACDFLQVQVLGVVHVIYRCREVREDALLSFRNITDQNCVCTNLYSYRSTTRKALAKFSKGRI